MSDWIEITLIGCVIMGGIAIATYGIYQAVSSLDLVTRTAMFLPICIGLAISITWSFEMERKIKELE